MFSEIGKAGTHTLLSYLAFEEDDGLLLGCKTVRFQAQLHGRKAGWLHGCITPCYSDHTVALLREHMAAWPHDCRVVWLFSTWIYRNIAIWPQFAWLRGWVAAWLWGCTAIWLHCFDGRHPLCFSVSYVMISSNILRLAVFSVGKPLAFGVGLLRASLVQPPNGSMAPFKTPECPCTFLNYLSLHLRPWDHEHGGDKVKEKLQRNCVHQQKFISETDPYKPWSFCETVKTQEHRGFLLPPACQLVAD